MSTNFAKEFKLYESLFSERKHKLTEEANTDLWASPESWTENNCPNEVYVVLTKDSFSGASDDVFLSWDTDDRYYTTVDYLDEVNLYDFHETAAEAEARAKDANSGTWGGWNWAPMHIIKIKNFRDAYFNGDDPDYDVVKTFDFTNKTVSRADKKQEVSQEAAIKKCDKCGEPAWSNDPNIYGNYYCEDHWDEYLDTDAGEAECFIMAADDPEYLCELSTNSFDAIISAWVAAKKANLLMLTPKEIAEYEQYFINNAIKNGIEIDKDYFNIK